MLKSDFSLILATNCRPFTREEAYSRFLDVTKRHKERIVVFVGRDKFHLAFFDPLEVIDRLRGDGYQVEITDYSNHVIALSEYNAQNTDLQSLDTRFSCCAGEWTDYLGILPGGGWTICPPSLLTFGDVFSNSLEEITEFKRGLPLKYKNGCTECLKDFKGFRNRFRLNSTSVTP